MNTNEKVAIITGAGGGVGKAISKRLFSEGAKLVLVGRDYSKLARLINEFGDQNKVITVKADVTKEADVLNVIEQTISAFDRIDILVNSAGTINEP
jgi:NADP-dependent 3-hydroxy acid dehydrogenase YdfG